MRPVDDLRGRRAGPRGSGLNKGMPSWCDGLHTARLSLEPVSPANAPLVLAYFVRNMVHLRPWSPPVADNFYSESFLAEQLAQQADLMARCKELRWWMRLRSQPDLLIGQVGLSQINRGAAQSGRLGYSIDAAAQGRGLMREALAAVIAQVFSARVDLHRLQANVRPENARSLILLKRLGFEREGSARDYLHIDGAWRDHEMFALRNPDFRGVMGF